MRNTLVTIICSAVLALAVGCGGSSSKNDDMTVGHDLTASGGSTCLEIGACAQAAMGAAAINACVAKGSTAGVAAYEALVGCGLTICTKSTDAGAAACASATDASMTCVTCVGAATQSTACADKFSACAAN